MFATQVLETLNKTSIPSRAELSDVSLGAIRCEAVMLNKGPHLVQAVSFLDGILRKSQKRFHKHPISLRTVTSVDLKAYRK
jgi:pyruvate kinase